MENFGARIVCQNEAAGAAYNAGFIEDSTQIAIRFALNSLTTARLDVSRRSAGAG
jgi:hypothetical protein